MGHIKNYRQLLEQKRGARDLLLKNISEKELVIKKQRKRIRNISDAIPFTQAVVQKTQEELKYHICELVSLALAAVFPEPYEFKLSFVLKRGKTEAEMTFTRGNLELDPLDGAGFGTADVAAFALRPGLWNLQRPRSRNTIIMDEPGRFISEDLQHKFAEMIKSVSKELDIQFIIITHKKQITAVADKVFNVHRVDGESIIMEEE